MAIYIRCLVCKKAAPREDRDAFIAAHRESCGSETRFRTFEAVDDSRDGGIKAEMPKAEEPAPEKVEDEEKPAEKFSSKKKFSKKKKSS